MVLLTFDNIDEARKEFDRIKSYNCFDELFLVNEHDRYVVSNMEHYDWEPEDIIVYCKRTSKPMPMGHARVNNDSYKGAIHISRYDQDHIYGLPCLLMHPLMGQELQFKWDEVTHLGALNQTKIKEYIEKVRNK